MGQLRKQLDLEIMRNDEIRVKEATECNKLREKMQFMQRDLEQMKASMQKHKDKRIKAEKRNEAATMEL